jgi:citrate lyase beta subunit
MTSDPTPDGLLAELDDLLGAADAAVAARRPLPTRRQPISTCYVSADIYRASTVADWGAAARAALAAHAAHPDLPEALGLAPDLFAAVLPRVVAKLDADPVEDLRIDFEDGYGTRSDAEEDAAAAAAGAALAATRRQTTTSGIRIKSMEAPTRGRAVRTLAGFLAALVAAGGDPGDLVVVTLPKVSHPDQVRALGRVFARLEETYGLRAGALRCELQVELPEAVLGADGTATVVALIAAADGRCDGLHYGTYDYSAALGIDPDEQRADHPAAEHAKAVLQVAAAGRGVRVVDGSSNVLPVGDVESVLAAWRIQARVVRRALRWGIAQGWDLHPAQLPCRYLVTLGHLRSGAPAARARLAACRSRAGSGFLDEPATERALLTFLERALACGALDRDEVPELTSLH